MEKKICKIFFTIIWAWQPFWSMDHAHFSNLSFSCPRRLCMKFEQHWPGGFRGKVIWNYQHFFHTNVWGPYKCIQKQTWPRRKKVKCQCMTIILATLVDRPFRWYMQTFSHMPSSILENNIFKCFFPIWMHREANDLAVKRSNFSNFGRPSVPDELCKDSAPKHPRFWRRRFLNVFTIYGHGGHLG